MTTGLMPVFEVKPGRRVFGRLIDGELRPVQGGDTSALWWMWEDGNASWIDGQGLPYSISHLTLQYALNNGWVEIQTDLWIDEGL